MVVSAMNGLSKLGTALAVVFLVLLVCIPSEILYVFYRRRKFRRSHRNEDDPEFSTDPFSKPPSKELLLYLFCWKTQTPIEPDRSPTTRVQPDAPPIDVGSVLKWQEQYGPSGILFTIKEEREGVDSSMEMTTRVVSLEEECFGGVEESTPFSTPCGSPFYYTPVASPSREVGNNGEENTRGSPGND